MTVPRDSSPRLSPVCRPNGTTRRDVHVSIWYCSTTRSPPASASWTRSPHLVKTIAVVHCLQQCDVTVPQRLVLELEVLGQRQHDLLRARRR